MCIRHSVANQGIDKTKGVKVARQLNKVEDVRQSANQ